MKRKIDSVFEDFPILFCDEFDEGSQVFSSWDEFIHKVVYNLHTERPKYVYKARMEQPENPEDPVLIHVDIGELVEVPWFELEKYI